MTVAAEIAVRMGECAVATAPGDSLVSFGLGSCIGLVLVDRRRVVAAMAHVMLPGPAMEGRIPGTFADSAVPHLLDLALEAGALRPRLEAILAGGAQMFAGGGSGLEIGARNTEAVRGALDAARIRVVAADTGGDRGRTMRVRVEDDVINVSVREAGGTEVELS